MQSKAATPDQYYAELPADRKEAMLKLRAVIKKNLPKGFEENMGYDMVGFSVPHDKYPPGYHCNPELTLPFIGLASQKHFIALYHMGIYAMPELHKWFVKEYPKHSSTRLDMGKSCIRFKKPEQIPYKLIGELASKVTMKEWITRYEELRKKGAMK